MTGLQTPTFEWVSSSDDPNDEQFGDVVERITLESADTYDAVLVGEPYDEAVIGRRGTAEGPSAIRKTLAGLKTHHFDTGPVSSVGDLGTVAIPEGDVRAVQQAVRAVAASVHDTDAFPVFVGGDNSLTYANASPLLDGSLGIINLDAHLDVREVRDDATSGTPYRQLFDAGLDAYICIGARHFETSTVYHDYVREQGGEVVTAEEVGDDPVAAAVRALDSMAGMDRIYLSLDCDVLDATAAPGVSAPTPGGLTTRECFRVLRHLASDGRLVGFEVLECAPPLDRDGLTVDAAARAIPHVLSAHVAGGAP
jgi:formimidoylglutamase